MAIVLDFDGTITTQDTIEVLAQHAISFHKEQHDRDLSDAWKQILESYYGDYSDYVSNYAVPQDKRVSLEEETKFLNGLQEVDMASLRRVEESKIFDGISSSDLFSAGVSAVEEGNVILRPGISELLTTAQKHGWLIYIVSVNWSSSFIEGVLQHFVANVQIVSNEVVANGKISGPNGTGVMATSADKARALANLPGLDAKPLVYFGDSSTDIECLSMSSGIVLSPAADSSLLKTLSRIGLEVPHVRDRKDIHRLSWARDFTEILEAGALSLLEPQPKT